MKLIPFLFVALAFAGCISDEDEELRGLVTRPFEDHTPLVNYLHDLSPADPDYAFENMVVEQYRTLISETIELDTWIARDPSVEASPIVLEVTPYYGGGAPAAFGRVGEELLARGYAVGISSVRGTGNSGGCFTQGGPSEAVDTAKVVEHMASQTWSNGNVGIMGVSYPGTTPQDVWVEATPSLKTIVPISGISDLYKYNFVNGVPILIQGYAFNAYYWALVGASPAGLSGGVGPTDPQHAATAFVGEACAQQADVQQGGATSTVDGNKDAYWMERDFVAEYQETPERERASVLFIHGLQDWNVKPHMMEDWLDVLWESGVDMKVLLGQWAHAWPSSTRPDFVCEPGMACRGDWWSTYMVAWFDQFLKETDTGILDAPPVQVQSDNGLWRHEHHFPANDTTLTLPLGDTLGAPGRSSKTYHDLAGGLMPAIQALTPVTSVEWISEPFLENTTLSGMPVFHGNVTTDGPRASLIFSLMEEFPSGERRTINFGIQSLNHVDSLENGNMDVTGLRQEVHLNFFPQDDTITEGSKLVLLASGNTEGGPGPGMQPQSTGSLITIEEEGAWLQLPIDITVTPEAIAW